MPDKTGRAIFVGDHVVISRMDEALMFGWLVGMTGVVAAIPNQAPTTQVIVILDDQSRLFGVSTQQHWLTKL